MAKKEEKQESITLTVHQKALEERINDSEDTGAMLLSMGVITSEQYKAGKAQFEDFRVKIEADAALAEAARADFDKVFEKEEGAFQGGGG